MIERTRPPGLWGKYTQCLDGASPGKHTIALYDALSAGQARILVQARTNHIHLLDLKARVRADFTVDGVEWIGGLIHSTPVDRCWSGLRQDSTGVEWIIQWISNGIGCARSNNPRSTGRVPTFCSFCTFPKQVQVVQLFKKTRNQSKVVCLPCLLLQYCHFLGSRCHRLEGCSQVGDDAISHPILDALSLLNGINTKVASL